MDGHVTEALAHGLDPAQIMVFGQQILKATVLCGLEQAHGDFV
jgi:hypothetical protein